MATIQIFTPAECAARDALEQPRRTPRGRPRPPVVVPVPTAVPVADRSGVTIWICACGVPMLVHPRCEICFEPAGPGHAVAELALRFDRQLCPSCAARVNGFHLDARNLDQVRSLV